MKSIVISTVVAILLVSACSPGDDGGSDSVVPSVTVAVPTPSVVVPVATTASTTTTSAVETASVVVAFSAGNGTGTVEMSGEGSAVVAFFGGLPGEVSLELPDADISDHVSVVEELIGFWFFQDEDSGDVPPSIFISDGGEITDSFGTTYVVEAAGFPPAPGTQPTTTTSAPISPTTSSTTTSISPTSSTTLPTTTTSAPPTTTTIPLPTTTVPAILQVQVLNGSGVAGAAGRMSVRLSEAGFVMLPAGNATGRYRSSAVYFADGWQREAERVLSVVDIDGVEAVTAMPPAFADSGATVVVLLGTDTAPARSQTGLRPRPRNDVALPLPDSIPRDRFVPGLSNIQIFSQINDEGPEFTQGTLDALAGWLNVAGRYSPASSRQLFTPRVPCDQVPEGGQCLDGDYLAEHVWDGIERALNWLGFTPQNVCGAPPGYSFTDLLKPTREWSEEDDHFSGDGIRTTDRLIELHGGERINPESNLDFYISEAVQTAYDILRSVELLDETEAPQLILCEAWISPSGEIPEFANAAWYSLLTPGIQPRESLLSQGTYHMKSISRNGNRAFVYVCHPTLGEQGVRLTWREAGYRAESVNARKNAGCQASFEEYDNSGIPFLEDTISFGFGEHVFSASSLQNFPRAPR